MEDTEGHRLFVGSAHALAEHYAALGNIASDFRNHSLNRLLLRTVLGNRVLDIGCGTGYLLGLLKKEGKTVVGIEPNKRERMLAEKYNPGIRIFSGFAEDTETLIDFAVDSIVMADVLEHIEDDRTQLQQLYGFLHSGGRLILVVPAYAFLYGNRDKRMGHYRRYSKSHLVSLLTEAGFRIVSIRYWNMLGFFPYLYIEKVLNKELGTQLRTPGRTSFPKRILRRFLHVWFAVIENRFDFGFGLSLICVAEKT